MRSRKSRQAGRDSAYRPRTRSPSDNARLEINLYSFTRLCGIGGNARSLGMVDADRFDDRRNPPAIENTQPREFEPESGVEIGEPEVDWRTALPQIPDAHFLNVEEFEIPQPQIVGYDYDPADQPVLLENWIEKTTANDILEPLAEELGINLVPASGTQSITAAIRLLQRCRKHGKPGHVLYISDYDKAGRHMPRAVARHLEF